MENHQSCHSSFQSLKKISLIFKVLLNLFNCLSYIYNEQKYYKIQVRHLPGDLGKGITSLTPEEPSMAISNLSNPRPNPPVGQEPNWRSSRYLGRHIQVMLQISMDKVTKIKFFKFKFRRAKYQFRQVFFLQNRLRIVWKLIL